MIEDLTVSAPDSGALADNTEAGGPLDSLTAYFMGQSQDSGDQVDNSQSESDDQAAADDTAADQGDDQQTPDDNADDTADATGEADAKPDSSSTADEPAEATEANFDALTPKAIEYLDDAKALKAKFPRNSSNELLAEMAEYGAAAKKGQEVIQAIGGEEFVPGVSTIAKGLQAGNPRDVFTGIVETASAEELIKVLGDAVYIGLVQAESMAQNPETEQFGKALTSIIDGALKEKFGPTMDVATMSKLALWHQAGWFEKIEKWTSEEYIPHDELTELLEVTNDPKLLEAQNKIKELEAQLGQTNTKAKESTPDNRTLEIDKSFSKLATDEIGKTLSDIVWKTSTLRDIPADTPETKEEKAFLRNLLKDEAMAAFQSGDLNAKLLEGFRAGKQTTAVFQKEFAEAIGKAVLATRQKTVIAERMLAKLYGKSRNTQLAGKNAQRTNQDDTDARETYTPTQTTDFGGREKLTGEQIRQNLIERIANLPG